MEHRDYSPRLENFAKQMRRKATDAERRVWNIVRAGRMHGWWFRRQHPFAGFILDFYCDALRLVIEVDGGQHYGRHGREKDAQRTAVLEAKGIKVIRFSDYDVLTATDGVMESIAIACRDRAMALKVSVDGRMKKPSP